jgi:hypothetical protein
LKKKKIRDENIDSILKHQYETRLQEIESEIKSLNSRHQILKGDKVARDPLTEIMKK